ncbi:MAG: hypothetical protein RLZZ511_2770 [Cyanobacteriota bacterium]
MVKNALIVLIKPRLFQRLVKFWRFELFVEVELFVDKTEEQVIDRRLKFIPLDLIGVVGSHDSFEVGVIFDFAANAFDVELVVFCEVHPIGVVQPSNDIGQTILWGDGWGSRSTIANHPLQICIGFSERNGVLEDMFNFEGVESDGIEQLSGNSATFTGIEFAIEQANKAVELF